MVSNGDELGADFTDWIARGYSRFKIKLLARSAKEDAFRTEAVFHRVRECGIHKPVLSIDSNEANPDSESVMDYLQILRADALDVFSAIQYLEQPTARDIPRDPFEWHDVARLKPVLLDEGLTSLGLLPLAKQQGWSGLALKTCKGHSFALCAGAWANQNGMLLAVQDLTNPGLSAIHSCLFAAHIPTINRVELNSPQFTPAANEDWLPRLGNLFATQDGHHRLPNIKAPRLSSAL